MCVYVCVCAYCIFYRTNRAIVILKHFSSFCGAATVVEFLLGIIAPLLNMINRYCKYICVCMIQNSVCNKLLEREGECVCVCVCVYVYMYRIYTYCIYRIYIHVYKIYTCIHTYIHIIYTYTHIYPHSNKYISFITE